MLRGLPMQSLRPVGNISCFLSRRLCSLPTTHQRSRRPWGQREARGPPPGRLAPGRRRASRKRAAGGAGPARSESLETERRRPVFMAPFRRTGNIFGVTR